MVLKIRINITFTWLEFNLHVPPEVNLLSNSLIVMVQRNDVDKDVMSPTTAICYSNTLRFNQLAPGDSYNRLWKIV